MAIASESRRTGRGSSSRDGGKRLYAALDLGTNNCRLLIAHPLRSGRLRIVDSYSQVVRLGEGLAATGELSTAAMDRTMAALDACLTRVRRHKPVRTKFIATQACRAASNGAAFLERVRSELGLKLDTISPKQEAKYALLGSYDLIDEKADFCAVIDIGGGSTEVCWVDAKTAAKRGVAGCATRPPILGWESFPFGVVTLSETFPGSSPEVHSAMKAHVMGALTSSDAARRFGPLFANGRGQLIGNSGTVTCVTAVSMGLERYTRSMVDGAWISQEDALKTCDYLIHATHAQRAAEPCVGEDRAELISAGCAIMAAIWEVWPSSAMRVGDRGLREGILLSMIHGPNPSRRGSRKRPASEASA